MYPNLNILEYSKGESSIPSITGAKWTNLQWAARKIPQILLGFSYKKNS
jgi:hypothetical protein